jgi:hypothetical protein
MEQMLKPESREDKLERIVIKWWRGWYALGWRGKIARRLSIILKA